MYSIGCAWQTVVQVQNHAQVHSSEFEPAQERQVQSLGRRELLKKISSTKCLRAYWNIVSKVPTTSSDLSG